jgi:hypothetical protein
MTQEAVESKEESESLPLSSSPSAWWRAPERLVAVAGVVGLRLADRLSEEWTAAVLLSALGTPVVQWLMRRFK